MTRFLAALLGLSVLPLAPVGAGDKKKDELPGVTLTLTITAKEYDPNKPSKGTVRCVLVNNSKEAVQAPPGYGHGAFLLGQGDKGRWEMKLFERRRADKVPTVAVEPGKERVLFELSLDEILFNGGKGGPGDKERRWGWDWIARPAAPATPIHVLRGKDFLPSASFWAEAVVSGKTIKSKPVELKVVSGQKQARDIFDHDAHKAAKGVKRIVLVADTDPHGPRGNHEFVAAAIFLARGINEHYPDAYAAVYTKQKWPKDLKHADAVIVLMNHGGSAVNAAVKEATGRGAGFMAVHYGVEVSKGEQGKHYLQWLGGYFETFWSVNPWWTPEFKDFPDHPTTRGVKPFKVNDEWYYHMRFVDGMKGVTPILKALPPLNTVGGGGKTKSSHGGNPDAYESVKSGQAQVMAWAYDRPDGARGFGFTGLHKHDNLGDASMRTLLLNAAAWVSGLEVPAAGVPSRALTRGDLEQLIDDGKLAVKRRGI